jgi:predicted  nucleic acid-binding Zn ribbon protein
MGLCQSELPLVPHLDDFVASPEYSKGLCVFQSNWIICDQFRFLGCLFCDQLHEDIVKTEYRPMALKNGRTV